MHHKEVYWKKYKNQSKSVKLKQKEKRGIKKDSFEREVPVVKSSREISMEINNLVNEIALKGRALKAKGEQVSDEKIAELIKKESGLKTVNSNIVNKIKAKIDSDIPLNVFSKEELEKQVDLLHLAGDKAVAGFKNKGFSRKESQLIWAYAKLIEEGKAPSFNRLVKEMHKNGFDIKERETVDIFERFKEYGLNLPVAEKFNTYSERAGGNAMDSILDWQKKFYEGKDPEKSFSLIKRHKIDANPKERVEDAVKILFNHGYSEARIVKELGLPWRIVKKIRDEVRRKELE